VLSFTEQIEISRSYGTIEWREDLKRLCRRAGGDNKPSVLLFTDMQIKSESFVEDINNLLNTGEVHSYLLQDDEKVLYRPPCSCKSTYNVSRQHTIPEHRFCFQMQVPNMFPYDERASVAEQVRALAKKMGRALDTPQVGKVVC
jgi:dynein heavy chain